MTGLGTKSWFRNFWVCVFALMRIVCEPGKKNKNFTYLFELFCLSVIRSVSSMSALVIMI